MLVFNVLSIIKQSALVSRWCILTGMRPERHQRWNVRAEIPNKAAISDLLNVIAILNRFLFPVLF